MFALKGQAKLEIMLIYAFQLPQNISEVEDHLHIHGMASTYTTWIHHGETLSNARINENCDHVDEQLGLHEDVFMDDGEQDDPNDTLPNMQQLYLGASYTRFSFMVKVGEGTNKSPQKAEEDARWHKLKRKVFDLHAALQMMANAGRKGLYILGTLLGIPGKWICFKPNIILMICNMAGCTHCLFFNMKERTPDLWLMAHIMEKILNFLMMFSIMQQRFSTWKTPNIVEAGDDNDEQTFHNFFYLILNKYPENNLVPEELVLKYPENDLVSEEPVLFFIKLSVIAQHAHLNNLLNQEYSFLNIQFQHVKEQNI
ncbi:hypothetical protein ACJX0J_008558 [Zea mays]